MLCDIWTGNPFFSVQHLSVSGSVRFAPALRLSQLILRSSIHLNLNPTQVREWEPVQRGNGHRDSHNLGAHYWLAGLIGLIYTRPLTVTGYTSVFFMLRWQGTQQQCLCSFQRFMVYHIMLLKDFCNWYNKVLFNCIYMLFVQPKDFCNSNSKQCPLCCICHISSKQKSKYFI